jgi:hypothetical protein
MTARPPVSASGIHPDQIAHALDDYVIDLFSAIAVVAEAAETAWRMQTPQRASDVASVRPAVLAALHGHDEFHGCGFVVAVGELEDRPRHWEWFVRDQAGGPARPLRLRVDESGETYAYELLDAYRRAASGRDAVAGPFLDFAGADRLIVSIYRPVMIDGRFVGLAGADLLLSGLERVIRPFLRSSATPLALINDAGRVIVANTPEVETLERPAAESIITRAPIAPGRANWTLATLTL